MRRLLLGCVCAASLGGCGMGVDAEQTVKKSPATVYSAMASVFDIEQQTVIPGGPDGKDVTLKVEVEREPGERLQSTVFLDGEEAGSVEFTFAPQDGGKATRMTGEIDVDQGVLKKHLHDGPNGDIGRIPEFAFDLGMKSMLTAAAERIEQGLPLAGPRSNLAALRSGQESSNEEERKSESEQMQRQATAPVASNKPMVDPNESARRYMARSPGQP